MDEEITPALDDATRQALWEEMDAAEAMGLPLTQETPERQDLDSKSTTATDEPKAEAQTPADAAPAAPAPAAEVDPYEGLSPAVKQELLGFKTLTEQLGRRLRQAEGHIGGLNNQLRAALAVRQAGGSAPSQAQIAAAQNSTGKLAKLKEDFPEFAAAIEETIAPLASAAAEVQTLKAVAVAQQQQQVTEQLYQAVEVKHPGWRNVVATPAFVGWLQSSAPPEAKLLAASPDPEMASRLLDIYKAQTQQPAAVNNRASALAAAAAIPQRGVTAASQRQKAIEDMSPEEYWRYLDEQDRSKTQR